MSDLSYKAICMIANDEPPELTVKKAIDKANTIIANYNNDKSTFRLLPEALKELLKFFWYDVDNRVQISQYMHDIGRFLCQNHQDECCKLQFDGEHYYTECPNELLHRDFGFSLRGIEKYACSVCGLDPLDCMHIGGEVYDNIKCFQNGSFCNICNSKWGKCNHNEGAIYNNVIASKIVTDLEIITFDLVKEPEQIFTRIVQIPYTREFIENIIADSGDLDYFKYGESTVYCSHCIECEGYDPNRSKLFDSMDKHNN